MTPTQIDLIRASWSQVEPIADTAARLFYARLFELDPRTKVLFRRTDMDAQRKNLMQTLAVVVKGLDQLDTIVPRSRRSAVATQATAFARRTTTRSGRRCSGPWSRASAPASTSPPGTPGRRPTACSPR